VADARAVLVSEVVAHGGSAVMKAMMRIAPRSATVSDPAALDHNQALAFVLNCGAGPISRYGHLCGKAGTQHAFVGTDWSSDLRAAWVLVPRVRRVGAAQIATWHPTLFR
jgi:hypothetical protein